MFFSVPVPKNEPVLRYEPGSDERSLLKQSLESLYNQQIEIPAIINGKEVFSGDTENCICPHDHQHILARYHKVNQEIINRAIEATHQAQKMWEEMPFYHRSAIFLTQIMQ